MFKNKCCPSLVSALTLLVCLCATPSAMATNTPAEKQIINYHGPESTKDVRYHFHWKILEEALNITSSEYGDVHLRASIFMTEDRQLELMKKNSPLLQVMIRETNTDFENILEPVRLPIDRNLIGYRLFLTSKKIQPQLSKINSLDDLKKHTFVQGEGWGDVQVLEASNLKVKTELYYDDLFKNTALGRYEAFPRGVTEISDEYSKYRMPYKDLCIEPKIMIFYPLPTYFWFQKTPEGKLLAQRVEKGMKQLQKSGLYEKIFQDFYADDLKTLNLKHRKLIRLTNPYLPSNLPKWDSFWQYNPKNVD